MVNRLTQIYTKTGDEGKTGLGDGTRVAKFSTRIECLGNVDELNSIIGLILTENVSQTNILKKIQHDLF
jgi:cob(I)alamin adenosyltransferase